MTLRCTDSVRLSLGAITLIVATSGCLSEDKSSWQGRVSARADPMTTATKLASLQTSAFAQRLSGFSATLSPYGTPLVLRSPLPLVQGIFATTSEAAKEVVVEHADLFGLSADDTVSVVGTPSARARVITLQQRHRGVLVDGALLHVLFSTSGLPIGFVNHFVPYIRATSTPTLSAADAAANLAAHDVTLVYARRRDRKDTAALAWRIRTSDATGEQEVLLDAGSGAEILRRRLGPHGVSWVGLRIPSSGCSSADTVIAACNGAPPSCGDLADPIHRDLCTWAQQVHAYAVNSTQHTANTHLQDLYCFDVRYFGMCPGDASASTTSFEISVHEGYASRDVVAHEFAHVISTRIGAHESGASTAIGEHFADVVAAAVDGDWVVKSRYCDIRNLGNPPLVTHLARETGSVLSCGSGCLPRTIYPQRFDDLNAHGVCRWGGTPSDCISGTPGSCQPTGCDVAQAGSCPAARPTDLYSSWHVGSLPWSQIIYSLAQKPGVGLLTAVETAWRAQTRLGSPNDFSAFPYAAQLQQAADELGVGSYMTSVQQDAKLWQLGELSLTNSYSRPAIVTLPAEGNFAEEVHVFFNYYVPGTDRLYEVVRWSSGWWWWIDTGLSPSTVGSGITSDYDPSTGYLYVGWRGWDGYLRVAKRSRSGSWSSLATLADTSTHTPSLVGGGGQMLMFYRNSQGKLRYLRDLGWGWVGPYGPPAQLDYGVDGDVSATWDSNASKFQIAFRSGGLARVMALDASSGQFSQTGHMLSCSFATSSTDHFWAAPLTGVATGNTYLLLGGRTNWDSWSYTIEQARATRSSPGATWQFDAHSYIELVGTQADSTVFNNKWYMVLWHDAPPGYSKTATVQWRSL